MEDKILLQKLKKNDEKAFEQLFRKYFFVLQEYANFYTRDLKQAEDIVQDVFLRIWDTMKTLRINTSLKAYLYRSVHNSCIQYLRHQAVKNKHDIICQARLDEAAIMNRLFFESGLQKLFENEIESLISLALSEMNQKTKEIYLLSRHSHLKNSEIAKKLKLTEKAVEYHITKALSVMRRRLKDYLPEGGGSG